jgi:hypothetical protein
MTQKIYEPVSVNLAYNHEKQEVFPKWISWKGRLHPVLEVGLHHTYREGKTLFHVFSVISKTLYFRLILNTETLHWKLEEIMTNDN